LRYVPLRHTAGYPGHAAPGGTAPGLPTGCIPSNKLSGFQPGPLYLSQSAIGTRSLVGASLLVRGAEAAFPLSVDGSVVSVPGLVVTTEDVWVQLRLPFCEAEAGILIPGAPVYKAVGTAWSVLTRGVLNVMSVLSALPTVPLSPCVGFDGCVGRA